LEKSTLQNEFINIIVKSSKDNTYKFALAKALLDISYHYDNNEISFYQLSQFFLKYYWYQEVKYKLKQNFQKNKQPVIISIIRKYCGEDYIREDFDRYFAKFDKEKKRNLLNEMSKKIFNDVIPRFDKNQIFYNHNYEKNGKKYKLMGEKKIYLKQREFFKENYVLLHKLVILEWAKFLEKINFTPRLISKIETLNNPKRSSLKKYKNKLKSIDKNKCFYCGKELSEFHIDHFIPWSYVYEDKEWNLVLSCSDCNRNKKDYLPTEQCIKKLLNRNKIHNLNNEDKITKLYKDAKRSGFIVKDDINCHTI